MDQQILDSDVIVVASLVSVAAGVQTISGDEGVAPTYRPKQLLRFRAYEYLKGTGPDEFVVEVLDYSGGVYIGGSRYEGYLTEADAMTAASALVSQRNTAYDDKSGVLFLFGPLAAPPSPEEEASGDVGAESTPILRFLSAHPSVQSSFEYSIDTLSRAWLPAKDAPTGGATGETGTADPEYITDGSETPSPVVSLSSLRTRVGEIDAMLAAGEGIEGYADCIYSMLTRERYYRDWTPTEYEATIVSGKDPQADPFYKSKEVHGIQYNAYWTSGPDSELFQEYVVDNDDVPSNGYYYVETTKRPLPAGLYSVNFHQQGYKKMVCNFKPTDGYSKYEVTVEAPLYTLHESFFDPVAIGTGVGADGTNGVLSPTGFTVGGVATEMTGLGWESGEVALTLSPHASLFGYALEFIELDGSVSLSLVVDDAEVDEGVGAYSWVVESLPWEEGDLLMLRIREAS